MSFLNRIPNYLGRWRDDAPMWSWCWLNCLVRCFESQTPTYTLPYMEIVVPWPHLWDVPGVTPHRCVSGCFAAFELPQILSIWRFLNPTSFPVQMIWERAVAACRTLPWDLHFTAAWKVPYESRLENSFCWLWIEFAKGIVYSTLGFWVSRRPRILQSDHTCRERSFGKEGEQESTCPRTTSLSFARPPSITRKTVYTNRILRLHSPRTPIQASTLGPAWHAAGAK